MASIRKSIIDNVVTTLEGITTGNGYNQTVNLVSKRLKNVEQMKGGDFPALFPIDGDEEIDYSDNKTMVAELEIIVTGYVQDNSDPESKVTNLLEDVEKALCVDRTRGGYALETKPERKITDKGAIYDKFGIFDFTFIVKYEYEYGTP